MAKFIRAFTPILVAVLVTVHGSHHAHTAEVPDLQIDVENCKINDVSIATFLQSSADPDYVEVTRLFELVTTGNREAFDLATGCRHDFDGAYLQEVYVTTGYWIDIDPDYYLSRLRQEGVCQRALGSFLLALPWDFVDDLDGKNDEISRRLEIIRTAERSATRDEAIGILDDHLRGIQRRFSDVECE